MIWPMVPSAAAKPQSGVFVGEVLAEVEGAGVVHVVAEAGGAQGAGEGGEEMGGDGFVIPDVSATAVAAAGVIVGAFEAVELAIGGAEADGRDEGGEIGAGGVLDGGGDGGFAEGGGEAAGLLFQRVEVGGGVFGGGPGVGEAGGVVVADESVFVALGRSPTAAARRAIGEMPGEEEGEIGVGAGSEGAVETERADAAARLRVRGRVRHRRRNRPRKAWGSSTSGRAASRAGK